jgi:hypothetical protein
MPAQQRQQLHIRVRQTGPHGITLVAITQKSQQRFLATLPGLEISGRFFVIAYWVQG